VQRVAHTAQPSVSVLCHPLDFLSAHGHEDPTAQIIRSRSYGRNARLTQLPRRTADRRAVIWTLAAHLSSPGIAYWMLSCSVYLYIYTFGANVRICRVECVRHKPKARSLRLGWRHRGKGVDHLPSASLRPLPSCCHPLRDLLEHRGVPVRQPKCQVLLSRSECGRRSGIPIRWDAQNLGISGRFVDYGHGPWRFRAWAMLGNDERHTGDRVLRADLGPSGDLGG
jgi:hypothetical protein